MAPSLAKLWDWMDIGLLYFFMTSTLTFCMSTFWLNSAGNFVDLSSLASTLEAMVRRMNVIVW